MPGVNPDLKKKEGDEWTSGYVKYYMVGEFFSIYSFASDCMICCCVCSGEAA